MTTSTHSSDTELRERLHQKGCDTCGMSEWSCNRLQDLVYDEMTPTDRRKLAVEIRQDMTSFTVAKLTEARIGELFWLNKMYRYRRDASLIGMDLNELRHIDKDLDEIRDRIFALQSQETQQ